MKKNLKFRTRRWGVIAAVFVLAWLVSRYLVQAAVVLGDSMNPAYHNLQFVWLDKRTAEFDRGDVVAFRCENVDGYLIKRIVAIPGDSVLIDDGTLYVNGEISSIYSKEEIAYEGIAESELDLSQDEYFVMGDNHEHSRDSRYEEIGCVCVSAIIGKVIE
jgi:signal peptidase I